MYRKRFGCWSSAHDKMGAKTKVVHLYFNSASTALDLLRAHEYISCICYVYLEQPSGTTLQRISADISILGYYLCLRHEKPTSSESAELGPAATGAHHGLKVNLYGDVTATTSRHHLDSMAGEQSS